jgi:hypothetical protein
MYTFYYIGYVFLNILKNISIYVFFSPIYVVLRIAITDHYLGVTLSTKSIIVGQVIAGCWKPNIAIRLTGKVGFAKIDVRVWYLGLSVRIVAFLKIPPMHFYLNIWSP